MTVNYTTNLSLGQPVTGTESGTWGDDVNNAVTAYLDIAIAGSLTVDMSAGNVTLTNTLGTNSATNIGSTTAQYAILNLTGAMSAARDLIVPGVSKSYIVNNNTTGGFAVTLKGASTTGITLANGERCVVAWNGSDYAKISTNVLAYLSGILPVASGGTGASSFTSSGLLIGNGTSAVGTASSVQIVAAIGATPVTNAINAAGATTAQGLASTLVVASGGTGLTSFTANQIHYGSFSQSAGLTFDGTNLATTGTATASKLIPTGASATGNGMYLPATNSVGISTAGTNAVYINASQNVGFGTSSPSGRVDAVTNGYAAFSARAATSGAGLTVDALKATDSTSANFANAKYSAISHIWNYNGSAAEAARIDSSGNFQLSAASNKILNSSGNPILRQSGSVLNIQQLTDAGSYTTSTSAINLNGTLFNYTPVSTSSTLYLTLSGYCFITALGSTGGTSFFWIGAYTGVYNTISSAIGLRSQQYSTTYGQEIYTPLMIQCSVSNNALTLWQFDCLGASWSTSVFTGAYSLTLTVVEVAV